LIPHLLERDSGLVFTVGPEQPYHFAKDSYWVAACSSLRKQAADVFPEESWIGCVVHQQARQRLVRIDRKVFAALGYSRQVEPESVEPLLDSVAMFLCRDRYTGEALRESGSDEAAKRIQEESVGVVELYEMFRRVRLRNRGD